MINIPKEAIESGIITVLTDTDIEVINAINTYNNRMANCRITKKHLDEIGFAFNILNPLVIVGMIAGTASTVFRWPLIGIIILAVYSILFITFSLSDKHYIISTIASSLLLVLDLLFIILLLANIVISIMYHKMNEPLKSEEDYPIFKNIKICYEKSST